MFRTMTTNFYRCRMTKIGWPAWAPTARTIPAIRAKPLPIRQIWFARPVLSADLSAVSKDMGFRKAVAARTNGRIGVQPKPYAATSCGDLPPK